MGHYHIILSSSYEECSRLRSLVLTMSHQEGYSEGFTGRLQLALHEAFVNAVKHGNKLDTALPVRIVLTSTFSEAGRVLDVEVNDSGNGFSLDEPEDPTTGKGVARLTGRGVYIIKSIADRVLQESAPCGSRLTMRFIPD